MAMKARAGHQARVSRPGQVSGKTASGSRETSDAQILRDAGRYLMNTYRRPPIIFVRGRGCYVYDQQGRKYLDFLGGIAVNALGYAHPRMVRVMRREAKRAVHVSNLFHHRFQGPLARRLAGWSGLDRVFFTNSGTEAVEGALKLARVAARKRARPTKRGSWPSRDRFTDALSGRCRSRTRQSIASPLRRWFPAWNSCALTTLPISKRNSTAAYAPSCWRRFREKAEFSR